jgi:hypothetical protein
MLHLTWLVALVLVVLVLVLWLVIKLALTALIGSASQVLHEHEALRRRRRATQ